MLLVKKTVCEMTIMKIDYTYYREIRRRSPVFTYTSLLKKVWTLINDYTFLHSHFIHRRNCSNSNFNIRHSAKLVGAVRNSRLHILQNSLTVQDNFGNGQNSSSLAYPILYIEQNRLTLSITIRHSAEPLGIRFDQLAIHKNQMCMHK